MLLGDSLPPGVEAVQIGPLWLCGCGNELFSITGPSKLDKYFNDFSRMVLKEQSPSPLGFEPMALWFKYKMHYSSLFREPYAIFRE